MAHKKTANQTITQNKNLTFDCFNLIMVRKSSNVKSVNVAPATPPDSSARLEACLTFGSVTPSMASMVMDADDTEMDAQLEGTHLAVCFALHSLSTALSNAGSVTESSVPSHGSCRLYPMEIMTRTSALKHV